MTRAGLAASIIFIVIGLLWAIYDPLVSLNEVAGFDRDGDPKALEEQLLRKGPGAIWSLRKGLEGPHLLARLRCARLLALQGDLEGQRFLLDTLRIENDSHESQLAEHFLLSIWDRREGPSPEERQKALHLSYHDGNQEDEERLDRLLRIYPAWVGGYVTRARIHIRNNELDAARRDGLTALLLEPNHFEATVLLGRCFLLRDRPNQALACFEQAIKVNPRIRHLIKKELRLAREEAREVEEKQRKLRALLAPVG